MRSIGMLVDAAKEGGRRVFDSLPIILIKRCGPPGCSSMKLDTSWMKQKSGSAVASVTVPGLINASFSEFQYFDASDIQLSQLTTGRTLLSLGQVSFS
jgi:hypothetical protein